MSEPIRVLLIEDDAGDADYIRELLSGLDDAFQLAWAQRLDDGLAQLEAEDADIALLDLGLPDSQGMETLDRFLAGAREVPVVVLTGLHDASVALRAVERGAQDYLNKGRLDDELLRRTLHYALGRKAANRKLRESDAFSRDVLGSLDAHIAVVDQAGTIIATNEGWERFSRDNGQPDLGCTGVGANYFAVCERDSGSPEADDARRAHDGLRRVLAGERDYFSLEYPCPAPDERRWFLVSITPLSTTAERGRGAVVAHINITARKLAEEALAQSERRFRKLFEESPLGIVLLDEGLNLLEANRSFVNLLGYDAGQLGDLSVESLTHPDDLDADMAQTRRLLAGEVDSYQLEKRFLARDGRVVWANLTASIIEDEQGNFLYGLGIVEDISERRAADERLRRHLARLQALNTIDTAISGSVDLRVTLNVILEQTLNQLQVDAALVLLYNPHAQALDYAAGRGFRATGYERSHVTLGEGLAGRAALERRPFVIHDLQAERSKWQGDRFFEREGFVGYYAVPLLAKGAIKGALELFHREPIARSGEWETFLHALASQTAIAIDNAQMFQDLQRSNTELRLAYDHTLQGWVHALDLRDDETEGHTQRVTEMTLRLARRWGVSEEELPHLRRGALLHDIGKTAIPDSILRKPGPLDDDEWAVMKQHPVYAHEWLKPIRYLRPALDIPYAHHERWDGTGYPRGLAGEAIPLAARLFAVVDVWDALRSDRPYRAAWPEADVRAHLKEGAGSHFDPAVVDAFLSLLDEG